MSVRSRARALVAEQALSPFHCRHWGLSSGANADRVPSRIPAAAARPASRPAMARASGDSAPPGARLVARLQLRRAHRPDRGSPDRQFQHRRRDRAHHPGRRAGQDRRRTAAAGAAVRRHRDAVAAAGRSGAGELPGLAHGQLRDRLLGQEPRGSGRRAGERGRHPLRQGSGGAVDRRQRRHRLSPGAGVAGPHPHRPPEPRRRHPRARSDQAAVRRRHRLAARHRAAGERGGDGARQHSAVRPDAAPEHCRCWRC